MSILTKITSVKGVCTFFIFLFPSQLLLAEDKFTNHSYQFDSAKIMIDAKMMIPVLMGDMVVMIPVNIEKPESKNTLLGSDIDENEVRDDVQNKIIEEYSNDIYLRSTSLLMANMYQQIISGSRSDIGQLLRSIYELDLCINEKVSNGVHGQAFIMPKALNTYQRSVAYLDNLSAEIAANGSPQNLKCN